MSCLDVSGVRSVVADLIEADFGTNFATFGDLSVPAMGPFQPTSAD